MSSKLFNDIFNKKKNQIEFEDWPMIILDQPSLDEKINVMCQIFKENKGENLNYIFRVDNMTKNMGDDDITILAEMLRSAGYIVDIVSCIDCKSDNKNVYWYLKVNLNKLIKN